jgi:hypothetical protein
VFPRERSDSARYSWSQKYQAQDSENAVPRYIFAARMKMASLLEEYTMRAVKKQLL